MIKGKSTPRFISPAPKALVYENSRASINQTPISSLSQLIKTPISGVQSERQVVESSVFQNLPSSDRQRQKNQYKIIVGSQNRTPCENINKNIVQTKQQSSKTKIKTLAQILPHKNLCHKRQINLNPFLDGYQNKNTKRQISDSHHSKNKNYKGLQVSLTKFKDSPSIRKRSSSKKLKLSCNFKIVNNIQKIDDVSSIDKQNTFEKIIINKIESNQSYTPNVPKNIETKKNPLQNYSPKTKKDNANRKKMIKLVNFR